MWIKFIIVINPLFISPPQELEFTTQSERKKKTRKKKPMPSNN